jgi:hypothetical protein
LVFGHVLAGFSTQVFGGFAQRPALTAGSHQDIVGQLRFVFGFNLPSNHQRELLSADDRHFRSTR